MISFRQPIGIPGKSQYVPTWGQIGWWLLIAIAVTSISINFWLWIGRTN